MKDKKWLIGSDFHIPYHDRRAMDMWFRTLKMWKPDIIDIAGDLDDMACVSRFNEGTADEVIGHLGTYSGEVKSFFREMREICPDSEIVFHGGNHEARVWKYISSKAPALTGLVTPESLWGLDTLGVAYHQYSDPPVHRYGDIFLHHGMYAPANAGSAVKKTMDNFHISIVQGHTHRQAHIAQSYPLAMQQELRGYEIGHMADIDSKGMSYDWQHDWQQGFAFARIDDRGHPHVNLASISRDYRTYVEDNLVEG